MEDDACAQPSPLHGLCYAKQLRDIVGEADLSKQCSPQRKQTIQNKFDQCVIEELGHYINEIARQNCQGCKIDHPSQTRHDYCLMDIEEAIEIFLFDAFSKMDEFDILKKWYPALQEMEANETEMVEAYRLWKTINNKESRNPTPDTLQYWSEKVKQAWTQ